MKPCVSLHRVKELKLTDITHFAGDDDCVPFFSRRLEVKDASGDRFGISIFAETAESLMTEEEREEAAKVCECDTTPALPCCK